MKIPTRRLKAHNFSFKVMRKICLLLFLFFFWFSFFTSKSKKKEVKKEQILCRLLWDTSLPIFALEESI